MKPSLLIVSPHFPPRRGGVADHTDRLAHALSGLARVTVLTGTGAETTRPFAVQARIHDWQEESVLRAALQAAAPVDAVIWQYVPHMYGRGGVNCGMPRVLASGARTGERHFVLAHEIMAPLSVWPQRLGYALAHRWQWHQILRHAEAVGISTEAWRDEWARREPRFQSKLSLVPSPASIPVEVVPADHAARWRQERGWPAQLPVLAYFGTISGPKQFDWVQAAWIQAQRPGAPVGLVVMGDVPAAGVPPGLEAWFQPLGYVVPAEVSRALQAVNVLALPFSDGVSERRTSFMAGLSHGCATVTTWGHNTGGTLRRAEFFKAVGAQDGPGFVEQVTRLVRDDGPCQALGTAARAAYQAEYDWARVVGTVSRWLEAPQSRRTGED